MEHQSAKINSTFAIIFSLCFVVFLNSCVSAPKQSEPCSPMIYGQGIKSSGQLFNFFMEQNPQADKKEVKKISQLYIRESEAEGINSDVAFVQMCLETGFLKFGNLVTKEMHNYCGLGAIDSDHPGETFETMELGVRAHIQHLHAYGTTEEIELKNQLIDRRYKYVKPRGKAADIRGLSGTWAMDPNYAIKLEALLLKLEQF